MTVSERFLPNPTEYDLEIIQDNFNTMIEIAENLLESIKSVITEEARQEEIWKFIASKAK